MFDNLYSLVDYLPCTSTHLYVSAQKIRQNRSKIHRQNDDTSFFLQILKMGFLEREVPVVQNRRELCVPDQFGKMADHKTQPMDRTNAMWYIHSTFSKQALAPFFDQQRHPERAMRVPVQPPLGHWKHLVSTDEL